MFVLTWLKKESYVSYKEKKNDRRKKEGHTNKWALSISSSSSTTSHSSTKVAISFAMAVSNCKTRKHIIDGKYDRI